MAGGSLVFFLCRINFQRRRKGTSHPLYMNIKHCFPKDAVSCSQVTCPRCHSTHNRKHGSYLRKGFHVQKKSSKIPMAIQRYRCLNPSCNVCTFSVLPCCVLRYCRFFYPGLLLVKNALSIGIPPCRLARYVWNVGSGVITRVGAELEQMGSWIEQTYREITDGALVRNFKSMVKDISYKLGYVDLTERYGYHRYPHRLAGAKWPAT